MYNVAIRLKASEVKERSKWLGEAAAALLGPGLDIYELGAIPTAEGQDCFAEGSGNVTLLQGVLDLIGEFDGLPCLIGVRRIEEAE